ncbi:MAG: PD-(D/E)XK nuclease family protein, partial [Spirochaetes bacterium]|nr:PD-(D/E)XK nuclease family protein [Spirochaetota bacterium]
AAQLLHNPDADLRPGQRLQRLLNKLSDTKRQKVEQAARSMLRGFFDSTAGTEARRCLALVNRGDAQALCHSEYAFVWRGIHDKQELFLSGSIDLLYGSNGTLHLVDFKTDRAINPEEHHFQLSLYRSAVEDMFGQACSAHLYYLRSGQLIPICDRFDSSQLAGLVGPNQPGSPEYLELCE